jgi:hypothetical protein
MPKKPITIQCAADIGKLFDDAQLLMFRSACDVPEIFENRDDFAHRALCAIERGMPIEEASRLAKQVCEKRGWSLE